MKRAQAGMTLIELMIAVAIVSMIATMLWSAFAQTADTKRIVQHSQDRYHEVRLAMSRIARELSQAFLTKNVSSEGQLATTPKSLFVTEDRPPFDRVDFLAFAHRRLYKDANESDQAEISYFVTRDVTDPKIDNLVRRESRRLDEDPRHGGSVLVLVPDVAEFDVTFFDAQTDQWLEYWDTTSLDGQPDRIPPFAKIVLVVNEGRGRTLRFVEKVTLHMENPIPEPRVRRVRAPSSGASQPQGQQPSPRIDVGGGARRFP